MAGQDLVDSIKQSSQEPAGDYIRLEDLEW